MCVCVHMCIYMYIHTYVHTYIHTYIHTRMGCIYRRAVAYPDSDDVKAPVVMRVFEILPPFAWTCSRFEVLALNSP